MTTWPRWYRYVGRGRLQGQLVLCILYASRAAIRNALYLDEWGEPVVAPFCRCVRRAS